MPRPRPTNQLSAAARLKDSSWSGMMHCTSSVSKVDPIEENNKAGSSVPRLTSVMATLKITVTKIRSTIVKKTWLSWSLPIPQNSQDVNYSASPLRETIKRNMLKYSMSKTRETDRNAIIIPFSKWSARACSAPVSPPAQSAAPAWPARCAESMRCAPRRCCRSCHRRGDLPRGSTTSPEPSC